MRNACKLKPTAILFKPVFRENSHDFVLVLSILNDNDSSDLITIWIFV